jgi:hypothetical protein
MPRSGPSTLRTFLAGPGEALPFQALVIRFEGVIRVEGNLLRSVLFSEFLIWEPAHHHQLVYRRGSITSFFLRGTRHLFSVYPGP